MHCVHGPKTPETQGGDWTICAGVVVASAGWYELRSGGHQWQRKIYNPAPHVQILRTRQRRPLLQRCAMLGQRTDLTATRETSRCQRA